MLSTNHRCADIAERIVMLALPQALLENVSPASSKLDSVPRAVLPTAIASPSAGAEPQDLGRVCDRFGIYLESSAVPLPARAINGVARLALLRSLFGGPLVCKCFPRHWDCELSMDGYGQCVTSGAHQYTNHVISGSLVSVLACV